MKIKKFNESLRDKMTGFTKEDVADKITKMSDADILNLDTDDLELFDAEELEELSIIPEINEEGGWYEVDFNDHKYWLLVDKREIDGLQVLRWEKDDNEVDQLKFAPYGEWDMWQFIMEKYLW